MRKEEALRPALGSPLIDTGEAATATDDDYRGEPRPLLGDVDIGAYEYPAPRPLVLTIEINKNGNLTPLWPSLTGENYTIRRATDDLDSFTDIEPNYPAEGTSAWTQEFIDLTAETGSTPQVYYQIVLE